MKKVYKFGDIFVTATFTGRFSDPQWDDKTERPEYTITLRTGSNGIRHSVKAWGNLVEKPENQHKSLTGLVLQEHLEDPFDFETFCGNFGYSTDSRNAERIWKQLKACYKYGFWKKLAENSKEYKEWQEIRDDLEQFLTEQL